MFKAYASFLLHLTPKAQRLLPRLDFQDTQAVFRAVMAGSARGEAPISAVTGENTFTVSTRQRGDGAVIVVLDHTPAESTMIPQLKRSRL